MNLKLRLNIIISALLLLVMLVGTLLMIRNVRDDVRAEVESSALLALHLLDAEILHYSSDYGWLNEVNPNKVSIFRLQSLENVRHLRIDFFDARGNLRDSNRSVNEKDERSAPVWFINAMRAVSETTPPVKRQIIANGRLLGELVVTPDPSYEISEIWNDMLAILVLASIFFVIVNAMIYWAVGRALRPLDSVLFAFSELEQGNLNSRLPSFALPELTEISNKFNAMAETLQNSIKSNRQLTQQMIRLQEEEKKSLAHDLHDEIGQHLTAIHIDASTILHAKTIADAHESAKAIDVVARQMMNIIRSMLQRLRPSGLDELGLKAALQDLIDVWLQRNSSVHADVSFSGDFVGLNETVAITVYRILQECLTNIARHSEANRVMISLRTESDTLILNVDDNGRGFNPRLVSSGFGVAGMRERIQGQGGHFKLNSKVGTGVQIQVILPFKKKMTS